MLYPLKSSNLEDRRRNARKKIIWIIIVLIIALIILATTVAQKALFFIAEPVWKIENYFLTLNSDNFQLLKSKKTLIAEKRAFENDLTLKANLIFLNDILQAENENLKDLLGRKTIQQKTVLAAVLVKPPKTPYDILTLDVGTNLGVKAGDKVIAEANVYIGEVREVYPTSAKVVLYSTPGEKRQVVLGTNSVSAEAIGIGGGNFNIFLPREVEVKENDVIVIPSITPNIFGIVEKVNFKDKDSFQTVLFKSPVNISELTWVEVIL